MVNRQGYGDYYKDHCFLWVDNSIIVDPTIKQFLQDERVANDNCQYNDFIQKKIPPFYIGSQDELLFLLTQTSELNRMVFSTSEMDDNWKWWRFEKNISQRFNLDRCVNDSEFLKTKPKYYHELVEIIGR